MPIILSIIALFFTWRMFKRENTLNNENFMYQKKFDSHNKLFTYGVEYMKSVELVAGWLNQIKKENSKYAKDEHQKALTSFVKIENGLEEELLKHSLILPENILSEYHNFLYGPSPWHDLDDLENWNAMIDYYYKKLETIHQMVSEDLHIKKLNSNLIYRFGKSKKEKLLFK